MVHLGITASLVRTLALTIVPIGQPAGRGHLDVDLDQRVQPVYGTPVHAGHPDGRASSHVSANRISRTRALRGEVRRRTRRVIPLRIRGLFHSPACAAGGHPSVSRGAASAVRAVRVRDRRRVDAWLRRGDQRWAAESRQDARDLRQRGRDGVRPMAEANALWSVEQCRKPMLLTSDRPVMCWRPFSARDRLEGIGIETAPEVRMPSARTSCSSCAISAGMLPRSPRCSPAGSSVSTTTSPRSVTSSLSPRRGGPVSCSTCGWRPTGLYCAFTSALASSTFPMAGPNRWATSSAHRFPFVQLAAAVGNETPG